MTAVPLADGIAAVAALGTAAFGLVDASKALWGGPSLFGFGYIRGTLLPFAPALDVAGSDMFFSTLKANWINGVAIGDQKAKAKSLIHLGITGANAASLAKAADVDAAQLEAAAKKIDDGTALTVEELTLLGRFDAIVSAKLDEAFERADQAYRNGAKVLACGVAVGLAVWADLGLDLGLPWYEAVLAGLVSTPLAPIAKDLASSLQTAAGAVSALKRS
jgi:hypothetical protein